MGDKTKIEWTDATWNPVTGCTKISAGCANCYAERQAKRLQAMGAANYRNGFAVTCHDNMLGRPAEWKRPRRIFVNSMSDLFHAKVPDEFRLKVFAAMAETPRHVFQVLTKRPAIARLFFKRNPTLEVGRHIWLGVSVEAADVAHRIRELARIPNVNRFVSVEPLLGPLGWRMNLAGIGWVIVGGESGPNARPMRKRWVEGVRDQCTDQGVPFFFKQWGGKNKAATGRELDGKTYDELPDGMSLSNPPQPPGAKGGRNG